MAQPAHLQPFINLTPFKGTDKENFPQFENQLRSCLGVANVPDAQKVLYLHLHLRGGALSYFDQLPEATRGNFDLAITALRNRYNNPQRSELHKIVFSTRKFDSTKESPFDFLTDLQRLAILAFPNLDPAAPVGVDEEEQEQLEQAAVAAERAAEAAQAVADGAAAAAEIAPNEAAIQAGADQAQDAAFQARAVANQARAQADAAAAARPPPAVAENRALERERRVREAFINGMPTKTKRYLLTVSERLTADQLCEKVSKRLMIDDIYPDDDTSAFEE